MTRLDQIRSRLEAATPGSDNYLEATMEFTAHVKGDIQFLLTRVEKLEAALRFYAQPEVNDEVFHGVYNWTPAAEDKGLRARQALSGEDEG